MSGYHRSIALKQSRLLGSAPETGWAMHTKTVFHAASPAQERRDEGSFDKHRHCVSSTLSRKAYVRRFFPFVTAFPGDSLDFLPRKG
jgi:hypothetical protein